MSLVSLDEDECLAYLEVPVTAVSMPLAELGAAAVDALVGRIEGTASGDLVVDRPIRLVGRRSVARRAALRGPSGG